VNYIRVRTRIKSSSWIVHPFVNTLFGVVFDKDYGKI